MTLSGPGHETAGNDSEVLLRKMLDASLNGVYVYDFAHGRNTFINARYTELTGYGLESLSALGDDDFMALFHADDRAAVREHMAAMRAASDGERHEIEYRFRRRDGEWIWCLSCDAVFGRDADGTVRSIVGSFLDISARKQADAALRRSESRANAHLAEIEHIYATAPVGLCVLDRDLRYVRINERLAQINGMPVEAHVGRSVREVLPALADSAEPLLRRVLNGGEPVLDIEIQGETPAQPGVQRTWVESWLPLHDAKGEVIGVNIVASEVTEQRRVQHEKAAAGALLEALHDNAAVGIAQTDIDGRFLRVNRRLTEITGYSREALLQRCFQDITHPDDLEQEREQLRLLIAGEIADYRMEKRYVDARGRDVWVKLAGSLVHAADGAPAYLVAVVDDISAQREAEAQARTLAKVVETSADFIGVARLDGYGLYLNPAGRAMVGIEQEFVARTHIEAYLFPEDLAFVRETVLPCVLRDGRWAGDFRFRHFQTGEAIAVAWDVVRIDDPASGEPELLATVTRDVRERDAREAALRDANRRKDEFLAVMGHELRNPMAPIRSAVDILLMRERGRDARTDRTLEILDRQTAHLGRLLDDLLDIARIERGRLKLDCRPVAIRDIMQEAADGVRQLMRTRHHQFDVEPPADDLMVDGDRVRLTQILLNLLLNAANYTPEGGRVRLAAEIVDDDVVVRVRDTGPGLSAGVLDRLFNPFSRAGDAQAGSQHGLGLGLAISSRLAERHHGRLEGDNNRPGPGAVFSLTLPRLDGAQPEPRKPPATLEPSPPGDRQQILVVEDNADVASAMDMLLQALGYRATIATTGSQALALTEDWCPRLALLDLGLPDMDGLELARRLRARHPDKTRMRLVAVTGFGHDEARERSLAAGIDEHIAKPIELTTLQRLLESTE
jgi:PAS domain S-box-containing protein